MGVVKLNNEQSFNDYVAKISNVHSLLWDDEYIEGDADYMKLFYQHFAVFILRLAVFDNEYEYDKIWREFFRHNVKEWFASKRIPFQYNQYSSLRRIVDIEFDGIVTIQPSLNLNYIQGDEEMIVDRSTTFDSTLGPLTVYEDVMYNLELQIIKDTVDTDVTKLDFKDHFINDFRTLDIRLSGFDDERHFWQQIYETELQERLILGLTLKTMKYDREKSLDFDSPLPVVLESRLHNIIRRAEKRNWDIRGIHYYENLIFHTDTEGDVTINFVTETPSNTPLLYQDWGDGNVFNLRHGRELNTEYINTYPDTTLKRLEFITRDFSDVTTLDLRDFDIQGHIDLKYFDNLDNIAFLGPSDMTVNWGDFVNTDTLISLKDYTLEQYIPIIHTLASKSIKDESLTRTLIVDPTIDPSFDDQLPCQLRWDLCVLENHGWNILYLGDIVLSLNIGVTQTVDLTGRVQQSRGSEVWIYDSVPFTSGEVRAGTVIDLYHGDANALQIIDLRDVIITDIRSVIRDLIFSLDTYMGTRTEDMFVFTGIDIDPADVDQEFIDNMLHLSNGRVYLDVILPRIILGLQS